mmetsp:Transcript_61963/g.171743  ORF Transcript_61963/g.171743 Transcript_61963/m.171743 type:complete len:269 (+) Transcript_61963:600-1406(+)
MRHVVLVQPLDVQPNIVPRLGDVNSLVMHLHREHLAGASIRRRVRWQEDDLLPGLHHTLLDAPSKHISDALDLVDPGDGHAHRRVDGSLRHTAKLVQHIIERVHMYGLLSPLDILTMPPGHMLRFLKEVVPNPAGYWQHRGALLNKLLLPANFHQHVFHLIGDFLISRLLVGSNIAIHLVHTHGDLLHAQQVDQPRVLPSLPLDLACPVVTLRDGSREVAVGRHHDEGNVGLGRASDHVLDEIAMARRVDDGIVPLAGEELLRGARDG